MYQFIKFMMGRFYKPPFYNYYISDALWPCEKRLMTGVCTLLPCNSEAFEPSPRLSLDQSLREFDLPVRVKIVILNSYNANSCLVITIFSMKEYLESYIFMEILENVKNRFLKNEESRNKIAKPDSVQSLIMSFSSL